MSAEQFDHIENKIRAAAENSEPAYEEQAWNLMNARLDKELRDKKRFFYWWLFPIFLIIFMGIGGLQHLNKSDKKGNATDKILAVKNNAGIKNPLSLIKPSNKSGKSHFILPLKNAQNKNLITAQQDFPQPPSIFSENRIRSSSQRIQKSTMQTDPLKKSNENIDRRLLSTKSKNNTRATADFKITNAQEDNDELNIYSNTGILPMRLILYSNLNLLPFTEQNESYKNKWRNNISADSLIKTSLSALPKLHNIDKGKTISASIKKGIIKNKGAFYLMASAGADAATVKFLSLDNDAMVPKYGAGLGYWLSNKIAVQTGFFISQKKYMAGPNDYSLKDNIYWSQVRLIKVNAACVVYEIPLSIRYAFLQKPGYKVYATTGISSYIMKKEVYDYHYFRNAVYQQSGYTYTGNKNLFSIISFSVGIEKRISKNLSVTAEPSAGLPLTGVGDGRVKLFSTALQVGLKYQPMKKQSGK